jgi:hypothetical protein
MIMGPKILATRFVAMPAFVAAAALALPAAIAQRGASPTPSPLVQQRFLVSKFPDKPSLPPTLSISLDPLGYTSPGAIYLGARYTLASLDFFDEDHLLFTFRVPGLLHRDASKGADSDERQIRAVVLALPQGAVAAEASWTLHDRSRYIWMLNNGHFLLRDSNEIREGDATLTLKPVLDFPGSLLSLEFDPAQQFMVTNSREPAAAPSKPAATNSLNLVPSPGSPTTASASVTTDDDADAQAQAPPEFVVRILHRDTGQVMLVSRVRSAIHLPINSTGYVENLRSQAAKWIVNFNYFSGGSKMLGSVDSACMPSDNFVSQNELFIAGCNSTGDGKLMAMTTDGKMLWAAQAPSTEVWPQLTVAPNGSRLAWATLDISHSVDAFAPMDSVDVKEQSVTVFNAANGDIVLVTPLSPILDSGGNVAISPSGRRVAILYDGAIQVFDLPAPPPLPAPTASAPH